MIYHEFEYELPSGLNLMVQLNLRTEDDWDIGSILMGQTTEDDAPMIDITETADQLHLQLYKSKYQTIQDFLIAYITANVGEWLGEYWEEAQERKLEG